jgi:hypothetical protein
MVVTPPKENAGSDCNDPPERVRAKVAELAELPIVRSDALEDPRTPLVRVSAVETVRFTCRSTAGVSPEVLLTVMLRIILPVNVPDPETTWPVDPLKLMALVVTSFPLKVPEFVIFPERLRAKPFTKNWFSAPLFTVRLTTENALFILTILVARMPAGLLLTIIFPNGIVDDTRNPFVPPALSLVPSPKRIVAPLIL